MNEKNETTAQKFNPDEIYGDLENWHVNVGGETIHAKRMPGKWRNLKWIGSSIWLIVFLGPYLRWDGHQAILFDIPDRQFHIFSITILPQDVWMLSLTLLFFAILLAAITSVAGRVYCGFFCFQTAWTDVFTWIEDKIEGPPAKRRKLKQEKLGAEKLRKKSVKYFLWLLVSVLTGISFVAWFTDAFELWRDIFTFQVGGTATFVIALFTAGTMVLAGKLREQACFWLCPYARIQGVMYDRETILPTYDFHRGEPRGRLKKGKQQEGFGDCIECNQCVAVCPTGIDIRQGQQEGCITCALCLDACDAVMDKIGRPRGLIRYASMDEMEGNPPVPLIKRPRVLIYISIITLALGGILYGLTHLGALELKVLHERQPLYVKLRDGSIQNKYDLKILNKTAKDIRAVVTASGIDNLNLRDAEEPFIVPKGDTSSYIVFITVPKASISDDRMPVVFEVQDQDNAEYSAEYESMFFSPKR